jgi:excinuclease ABC subunit A
MVVAEGTPEQVADNPASFTGAFLKDVLDGQRVPVGDAEPALLA